MAFLHANYAERTTLSESFNISETITAEIAQIPGSLGHVFGKNVSSEDSSKAKMLEDTCNICTLSGLDEFAALPFETRKEVLTTAVENLTIIAQKRLINARRHGSTLVFALLMGGDKCMISNTGDSAAFHINIRGNTATVEKQTNEHRATDAIEKGLVSARGGTITNGKLHIGEGQYDRISLSRTVSSHKYPGVTSQPDIIEINCTPGESFILLCSDGLTDIFKTEEQLQQAINKILQELQGTPKDKIKLIPKLLVETAKKLGITDDISVILTPVNEGVPSLSVLADGHGYVEDGVSQLIKSMSRFELINAITLKLLKLKQKPDVKIVKSSTDIDWQDQPTPPLIEEDPQPTPAPTPATEEDSRKRPHPPESLFETPEYKEYLAKKAKTDKSTTTNFVEQQQDVQTNTTPNPT